MGKICMFCQYQKPNNKCRLIVSNVSVEHTKTCTCYEPVKHVVPAVHAYWFDDGVAVKCSRCGWYMRYETRYCPDCGAKMDEEVDDAKIY